MDALRERISIIDVLIDEWFKETGRTEARPPELEEYLVSKGFYKTSDRNRMGRYFRNDLRKLEKQNQLNIFIHVFVERKPNMWIFHNK